MINPPAFQFYPKDFISDLNVAAMTNEEVGIYIKLLCHCWIEDGLPNIPKLLEGWFKGGSTKGQPWEETWLKIKHCFYEKNGKLRNKRLDEEREKQIRWSEKSKKGGLKSVENKRKLKGGSTKGQPRANQGLTLPLQSSSSNKNKSRDLYIGETEFIQFWESYPNKEAKDVALAAFKVLRKKESLETIAKAFNGYMDFLKNERIRNNFNRKPMNASTFLRQNRWKDFLDFRYEAPL